VSEFWTDSKTPIAIAHRGGDAAGSSQENTLAAFKAARELGYGYGETDVVLTKDGQVIAVHGADNILESLFRGRHSRRRMQRLSLEQIRKKFGKHTAIPTLEELLLSQRRMKFFIEPKTDEVVEPLYKLLKRLNVLDRVCVSSFSYQRLERFWALAGNRPVHTKALIRRWPPIINTSKRLFKNGQMERIEAVGLRHSDASGEMLELAHEQGLRAIIWTANSQSLIEKLLKLGVDGIISDNISLLKDTIASS
jgi:glycerophosphoryl diester phosphodiesterase